MPCDLSDGGVLDFSGTDAIGWYWPGDGVMHYVNGKGPEDLARLGVEFSVEDEES